MLPGLSVDDAVDGELGDAVLESQETRSLFCKIRTYGQHVLLSKFCRRVLFALGHSAMTTTIIEVVRMRVPSQIVKAVVCGIAVVMTGFHPVRARANERIEDKVVNEMLAAARRATWQADDEVSRLGTFSDGYELLPRFAKARACPASRAETDQPPAAPNGAIVANAVTWKAFDISVLNGRIGLHDRLPKGGCVRKVSGGNPLTFRYCRES